MARCLYISFNIIVLKVDFIHFQFFTEQYRTSSFSFTNPLNVPNLNGDFIFPFSVTDPLQRPWYLGEKLLKKYLPSEEEKNPSCWKDSVLPVRSSKIKFKIEKIQNWLPAEEQFWEQAASLLGSLSHSFFAQSCHRQLPLWKKITWMSTKIILQFITFTSRWMSERSAVAWRSASSWARALKKVVKWWINHRWDHLPVLI